MLTVQVNSIDVQVDTLTAAKAYFLAKRHHRSSRGRINDGLVKRDGKPVAMFSHNGRLWNVTQFDHCSGVKAWCCGRNEMSV